MSKGISCISMSSQAQHGDEGRLHPSSQALHSLIDPPWATVPIPNKARSAVKAVPVSCLFPAFTVAPQCPGAHPCGHLAGGDMSHMDLTILCLSALGLEKGRGHNPSPLCLHPLLTHLPFGMEMLPTGPCLCPQRAQSCRMCDAAPARHVGMEEPMK